MLSIALEPRLPRDRRWDADEIEREASGQRHEPRWRKGAAAPAEIGPCETRPCEAGPCEAGPCEAGPCERDAERDDDGLPRDAPLSRRIGRLKAIIEGAGSFEPAPPLPRAERRTFDGERLWTVSDEGRTVEQLARSGPAGFRLKRQFRLDESLDEPPPPGEADLEGIAIDAGRVWVCGSHARVRKRA